MTLEHSSKDIILSSLFFIDSSRAISTNALSYAGSAEGVRLRYRFRYWIACIVVWSRSDQLAPYLAILLKALSKQTGLILDDERKSYFSLVAFCDCSKRSIKLSISERG
jgi:hypothetical protein